MSTETLPTAAELMSPAPRTCSPHSSVTEAALIFRDADCGVVPIVDEGKPVGVLTDRDVALALAEHPDLPSRSVGEIMTRAVVTVPPEATVEDLEAAFGRAGVRRLLVVDTAGALRGVVSWSDLAGRVPEREIGSVATQVLERRSDAGPIGRTLTDADIPAPEPEAGERGPWAWTRPGEFASLLKETVAEFLNDRAPRLGAALAFYSVLSLAPLLLIAIAVVGLVFGAEAASGQVVEQLAGLVGPEGAEAIQQMIQNADRPAAGTMAAIVGVITLIFAASGVFGELQDAMNMVWGVVPKQGRGVFGMIRDRFLSFAMVFGTGFLLLVSLLLSTALAAIFKYAGDLVGGAGVALWLANILASFVVITLLFAAIFKVLPDARIAWRDVWVGAALTSVLFLVGRSLIGMYLGRSGLGSTYGAAGSLVALLVWVYYSAQILYLGAEFTQVYANRYGSKIRPARGATVAAA